MSAGANSGTFSALLSEAGLSVTVRSSEQEARRLLEQHDFHIVVIDAPMTDSFGCEFAASLSEFYDPAVMLVCRTELYDRVSEKLKGRPVFVLAKPFTRRTAEQSLNFIIAHKLRADELRKKAEAATARLEDEKVIERAKFCLMEYLNLSEPDAHRYIGKQAMDKHETRRAVAESILKTYL